MRGILSDLRHSFRLFKKQPRVLLAVVVTLALGIGATTAAFSIVNSALLTPLPFQDADRIVTIAQTNLKSGAVESNFAPANFRDIRDENDVFDFIAAHVGITKILTGTDEPESLNGISVSADLFRLLGVNASFGRTFDKQQVQQEPTPLVVISHDLWNRRFKGDASILDRSINLDGRAYTVVGVMPSGFDFPQEADFWVPIEQESKQLLAFRHISVLSVIARLKQGVTIESAQTQMDVLAARLEKSYPATNSGVNFQVIPFRDFTVRNARPALLLLLAAAAVLLLIACFNVANIFLARAIDTRREVAVRMALGATRAHVIRQFLSYSILVALLGGALGVFLATNLIDSLSWLLPAEHPYSGRVTLDLRVLTIATVVSLLSGVIFGLIAARHSIPREMTSYLKEGPVASRGRRDQNRLWDVLVVTEIALSLLLCMGAGLLFNSLFRLISVNSGFETSKLLIVSLALNQPKYSEDHRVITFYREITERISSMREIESAAIATSVPLSGTYVRQQISIKAPTRNAEPTAKSLLQVVGGNYFETLKIPLLAGRSFTPADREDAENVAIINEAASRQYFQGENPLEKTITLGSQSGLDYRIVGVVGNVRQLALQKESEPELFLPYEQSPWTKYSLILRTRDDPASASASVRSLIRTIDAEVPLTKVMTMDEVIAGSVMDRRLRATTFNIFAILGLALAAVGLYGLLSHSVKRRTHEIGVRMAIGAAPSEILKMIMKRGFLLIIIGVVIGVILSLYANRLLSGLLYGVSEYDILTVSTVCGLIIATGLIACYIPARRATKVDPVTALRN
ncbi:MAG: ABC transporter permease [Blastocatellia bacterium]|nr:ABC transporter permease [Blastocatellia bacterium]